MMVLGEGTSQAQDLDAGNRGQAGTRGVGDRGAWRLPEPRCS